MIESNHISQLNTDGFCHLKGFFQPERVAGIRAEAMELFKNQILDCSIRSSMDELSDEESFNEAMYEFFASHMQRFIQCGKQVQHLMSLHRLGTDEKLEEALKQIGLGKPNICTRPVMFFNHPKLSTDPLYNSVTAHQDWRSMQGSLNSVVVWLPLVKVTEDIGTIKVLPGSHKQGLITDHVEKGFGMVELNDREREKLISVNAEVGDVVVFSSLLIHESGNNITDKPRWSCHFRYNDMKDKSFISRGYPNPYLYKPIEELVTSGFPEAHHVKSDLQFGTERA